MAELAQALGDALNARYTWKGGVKRPVTHRQGLTARMNRIQKKVGGGPRAAAQAAGIPYSTWTHLASGRRTPSAKSVARLEGAFIRIVAAPARAAVVGRKGYPSKLSVQAVVVIDPEGSRYINGHTSPGPSKAQVYGIHKAPEWRIFRAEGIDIRPIVDAWLASGNAWAENALLEQVEDAYHDPIGFEGNHVRVTLHG